MLTRTILATISYGAYVAAQSTLRVVCIAGQCLEGDSNTTMGATLSAQGAPTDIQLLPGQYTSTTNPQLLHDLLTSSDASLKPFDGFQNASSPFSLPLDVALEPGMSIYSEPLYSGSPGFSPLPNSSDPNAAPISAKSLALSSDIWAAVSASGNANDRIVLWEAVPDVSQLPISNGGNLTLLDMQSSACSPACSGAGICTSSATCSCPDGFTGSSCESCASGHFGKDCQACPAGCSKCDEGISGSGRCLEVDVSNAPDTCNCLNGQCGSNGQCSCNTGWTTADNGTACAKCSDGFFLTSTGDCKACQLGCTQCADNTGTCLTCKSGFTQNANDRTKCNAVPSTTPDGTVCPDGSFSDGTRCTPCSPSCRTCTGGTSNDCVICASGTYAFNGGCVSADQNGVCEGTQLIADNNKFECDTCGAKCTACRIPNFSVASTVDQLECTACLPGSFLSNGQCVDFCPSGTFIDPRDNVTCTACSSSCGTCVGSADFCLTCTGGQLAVTSEGTCASSCPSGTFSSNNNACVACHPDCATCSGNSFNQCQSCPPGRPVLSNGRCLPTCSQKQYFDSTTRACQACDSSCSSCSGPGSDECLACDSDQQVLRGGRCQQASCTNSSSVIPGLGVCLSELVIVPQPSGTGTDAPQPSITGLNDPTVVETGGRAKLEWWQILLMALGCAFIFLVIVYLWRRRARRQRAKQTKQFAISKGFDPQSNWRYRLVRFGEKLFGHTASKRVYPQGLPPGPQENEMVKMRNLRAAEEARHEDEIDKLIGSYEYSSPHSRSEKDRDRDPRSSYYPRSMQSAPSLYSQMTGKPRKAPEPRQPVKRDLMASRFSTSTGSLNSSNSRDQLKRSESPAEAYAKANRPRFEGQNNASVGGYWLEPSHTGSSKNPFRR